MLIWHRLRTLGLNLSKTAKVEQDVAEEIRAYREAIEAEKIAQGLSAEAARREAYIETGGDHQLVESVRDVHYGASIEAIVSEIRHSLRGLRRNPALATLAIAMLAVGIGASTVVFSIFYAALLKPLPFRDTGHIVQIWQTKRGANFDRSSFSEANFWDLREMNRSFVEVAAYHYSESNLTGDGPAEKIKTAFVSAGFFRTLGVSPLRGRDFNYDDDRAGWDNRVALVGERFWRTRLASDPHTIGRTLRLNDKLYTIIGILPYGSPWLTDQVYIPFGYQANANRRSWEFEVIARRNANTSESMAQTDLQRVAATLAQNYPKDDAGLGFRTEPASRWIASPVTRRALEVLLGAVTLLLLIGCFNIANLLLARGTARQREITVRTALGASRARLIRFVLMESVMLSSFGACVGMALAYLALRVVRAAEVTSLPRLSEAALQPIVVVYAILAALLTGILAGLAPALQSPVDISHALRDGDRQTGSRRQGRLRSVFVASEVAISFTLLVGAGLLIRSFSQLMRADHGFATENRLMFSLSLPGDYQQSVKGRHIVDQVLEQLQARPEVISAGVVSHRPVEGGDPGMGIDSFANAQTNDRVTPWASWRIVTPGYFRAAGLSLARGRLFDPSDRPVWGNRPAGAPPRRVLVSEGLAKQLLDNRDPIGQHVLLWKGQSNLEAEIVGVIRDSRERGLAGTPVRTVYLPYGDVAVPGEFVVQTRVNPGLLAPAVRQIVHEVAPNVPVSDVRSFAEVMEGSVSPQRMQTTVLTAFSGLALLLAITGVYGVLSYTTSRRVAEIGLRVALGASASRILAMTIAEGLRPVMAGILIGAIAAFALSRSVVSLLYEVKPFDALTYVAVATLLFLAAAAACFIPGHRATRIDPAVALRAE